MCMLQSTAYTPDTTHTHSQVSVGLGLGNYIMFPS